MTVCTQAGSIGAGVVGLGLMGSSIAVALLLAGHPVKAIAPLHDELEAGEARIRGQLQRCEEWGLLQGDVEGYLSRLVVSGDYRELHGCGLVLECVIEDVAIKSAVYEKIAAVVPANAIIGSNTSAIPISELQQHVPGPERFMGIHWAEPAYATRFLEITCGGQTALHLAQYVQQLSRSWGKEATLLKKDIRGFITNRLMYAVYREAFHLVESGQAKMEDVDSAFRYDAGSWMTLMGIFRRMDFTGIADYAVSFRNLFPILCNSDSVPLIMQEMVAAGARGVHNLKGLYPYTALTAAQWKEAFSLFTHDIRQLAGLYPEHITLGKHIAS